MTSPQNVNGPRPGGDSSGTGGTDDTSTTRSDTDSTAGLGFGLSPEDASGTAPDGTNPFVKVDADPAPPAEEISGVHLAAILGKDRYTRLGDLLGADLASHVVDWNRVNIRHGRHFTGPSGNPITNPMAEDVLVVPMLDIVIEFLNAHGVTPPSRPEVIAFTAADLEDAGDGIDPKMEREWAEMGADPDLPRADDGDGKPEARKNGVPMTVYNGLELHEQKKVEAGQVIPSPNSPLAVARYLIREHLVSPIRISGVGARVRTRRLIRIDGTWYFYDKPTPQGPMGWIAFPDKEWLPGKLRKVLGGPSYVHTRHLKGGNEYELRWWNPNTKTLTEVEAALTGELAAGAGTAARELPDAYGKFHGAYGTASVLCRNGVLDPATGVLRANTPLWFSTWSIPVNYDHSLDPYAETEWLKTLRTQWPDDPGAITCLQQWFGYVISGRTDLQKWMFIIGPPGSSKGIIADVLSALTGVEKATSLKTLNGQFGLQSLYESGASLAVMGDIRFRERDSSTAVGNLLSVIGEDLVSIERKNKTDVSAKLPVRFHGSANEMPRWSDNSAALRRRTLLLETSKGFRGTDAEDHGLKQRILDNELAYVLRWAVEGLALLNAANGVFTQSVRAAELAADMDRGSSVVMQFVEDCIELGEPDDTMPLRDLYQVWKRWSEDTCTGRTYSQNDVMRSIRGMHHDVVKVGQVGTTKIVRGVKRAAVPGGGSYVVDFAPRSDGTNPFDGGGRLN